MRGVGWLGWSLSGMVACGAAPKDVSPSDTDAGAADSADAGPAVNAPRIAPSQPSVWPPEQPASPAVLDLHAVAFDAEAGASLRDCLPLQRDLNPPVLHVAPGDLDGDGNHEVVLGNLRCPDAEGAWVDDPVARWDAATERLVVGESFAAHFAAPPTDFGPAMAFLDVDADGDADLVGAIPDPTDRSQLRPVWWNDGAGGFQAAPLGPSLDGQRLAATGAFGVSLDADGTVHLWIASRDVEAVPMLPMAPADVVAHGAQLDAVRHPAAAVTNLSGAWSWVPVSLDATVDPFEHLFATVNPIGVYEDFHWRTADAVWEPDAFVDASRGPRGEPLDAVHFAQPACSTASATCFTPMGGSMLRLPDTDDAGTPVWRDCAAISTGVGPWPVFVGCPVQGRLLESGGLVDALRGPDAGDVRLAWQVSGTWDVNADGFHDVLVTNGRDAGPFPAQPSYAFLRRPGCFDGACGRYVRVDLPLDPGHHHGLALIPVRRADGGWTWLGLANSNAVDPAADARVAVFRWSPTEPDGWVSLGLGALHDLRAMGAVVTPRFVDAQGDVVVQGEPTLVALASTRGHPGVQQPMIWGLPPGAVSAVARVAPRGGAPAYDVALAAGVPTEVRP